MASPYADVADVLQRLTGDMATAIKHLRDLDAVMTAEERKLAVIAGNCLDLEELCNAAAQDLAQARAATEDAKREAAAIVARGQSEAHGLLAAATENAKVARADAQRRTDAFLKATAEVLR
jgi:hypothetical protein